MKFMLFVLPTVPATSEERRSLRPIGRNNERYQQMLDELRKLVILAEQAGFDVFSTTEHHFRSEGDEASVAPLLLYPTSLHDKIKSCPYPYLPCIFAFQEHRGHPLLELLASL